MIVSYQALNSSGTVVTDTLVAEDSAQAYNELKRSGLTPIRITEKAEKQQGASGNILGLFGHLRMSKKANPRKASRRELPFFTEQMSILLETGTPVAASLSAIERQVSCNNWRLLVAQLRQQVEEGGSLASAVAAYPEVFDPVYGSMISAGEASGNLSQIMSRLAQLSRQSDRIRRKIMSALIYPVLLSGMAFVVMVVLLFFVLPRFAAIFEEMNVTLPGTTKTLMVVSDFVRSQYLLVLAFLGAMVTGVVFWVRSRQGRRFIQRNILILPIFGLLVSSIINARIFRLLGLLSESSVPLLEALELTKTSTRHYLYAELLEKMYDNVLNGQPMYEVMTQSKLVPISIAQMVHTGEENAQIGRVMTLLADHLDDRNETKVSTLTSIMEPVILIFMGIIIGTVAVSLVLPMFDLSRISS